MRKVVLVGLLCSILTVSLSGCSFINSIKEGNSAIDVLNSLKGGSDDVTEQATESTENSNQVESVQIDPNWDYIPSVEEAAREQGLITDEEPNESSVVTEENKESDTNSSDLVSYYGFSLRDDGNYDVYDPSGKAYLASPDIIDKLSDADLGTKLTHSINADGVDEITGISDEAVTMEDRVTDADTFNSKNSDDMSTGDKAKVTGYAYMLGGTDVYVEVDDTSLTLNATKEQCEEIKGLLEKAEKEQGTSTFSLADIWVEYKIDSNGDAVLTKVIK